MSERSGEPHTLSAEVHKPMTNNDLQQPDTPSASNSSASGGEGPGHTPGPWSICPAGEARNPYIVVSAEGLSVADCKCFVEGREANARLIAAAPELLEVALAVADGNFNQAEVIEAARAAILKATGAPR